MSEKEKDFTKSMDNYSRLLEAKHIYWCLTYVAHKRNESVAMSFWRMLQKEIKEIDELD